MRFLVGLLLAFSLNTFAAEWDSLEIGRVYKLSQGFSLQGLDRSRSFLDFRPGQDVQLFDVVPLSMAKVIIYEFGVRNCPGPQAGSKMTIIPVLGAARKVEVGAQLENCKLQIYVEMKDIYTESMFK